jgi:hypothetical protein
MTDSSSYGDPAFRCYSSTWCCRKRMKSNLGGLERRNSGVVKNETDRKVSVAASARIHAHTCLVPPVFSRHQTMTDGQALL